MSVCVVWHQLELAWEETLWYSISVEQDAIDQEGLDLVRAATFVEACKGVIVEHT